MLTSQSNFSDSSRILVEMPWKKISFFFINSQKNSKCHLLNVNPHFGTSSVVVHYDLHGITEKHCQHLT